MKEPIPEIADYELDQLLNLLSNESAPRQNRKLAYSILRDQYSDHPRVAWHLRHLENDLFRLGVISNSKDLEELQRLPKVPKTMIKNPIEDH